MLTKKKTCFLYIILTIIACISLIFSNFSYDAEYQLAMAYRMLKGDSMITQMWEPHQTSAFLCAIIMKLYLTITHTTTGIVLFTQIVGFLIRGGISLYLYRTVKDLTGKLPALIAGFLYLLISPKDLLVPEFSNMQLWFATLTCLSLVRYFRLRKNGQLVLSAICLCLGVFSYPSFIIAYVAVFFLLLKYSNNAKKDILLFTGICALIGGTFVGYLLINVGYENIINCLPKALAIEPSHTVSMLDKALSHMLNIAQILGVLATVCAIGFSAGLLFDFIKTKKNRQKISFSLNRCILLSWFVLLALLLITILRVENNGATAYPLLMILALGLWQRNLLSDAEKHLYYSALWIGIMNLLSTMLLSDHGILQAVPYMHIAICVSVIPLYHWFRECIDRTSLKRLFVYGIHAFMLLTIFRSIYIHVPLYSKSQICSLASDMALIRSGPALGILTDEVGAAKQRDSLLEWKEYIRPGDTIWILGEPVDTLGYLYEDVEVGAPTVMSTPTYNSELLYYWEINPDKYPDVVIMTGGFGDLALELAQNDWLMNWVVEEYQADTVIDGNYWRYYIKRQE